MGEDSALRTGVRFRMTVDGPLPWAVKGGDMISAAIGVALAVAFLSIAALTGWLSDLHH